MWFVNCCMSYFIKSFITKLLMSLVHSYTYIATFTNKSQTVHEHSQLFMKGCEHQGDFIQSTSFY